MEQQGLNDSFVARVETIKHILEEKSVSSSEEEESTEIHRTSLTTKDISDKISAFDSIAKQARRHRNKQNEDISKELEPTTVKLHRSISIGAADASYLYDNDPTIHVPFFESGEKLHGPIVEEAVCLSYHDEFLAAGFANGSIYVWNNRKPKPKFKFQGQDCVTSIFIAPDKILWASCEDSKIRCWNLQQGGTPGKTVFTCKNFAWINQILVEGKTLYACNGNVTIIFKIPQDPTNAGPDYTDAETARLEGHTDRVTAVALDSNNIYTASYDRSLRIYNKQDFTFVSTIENAHRDRIVCLASHNDLVYMGSDDHRIGIVDAKERKLIRYVECADRIFSLRITPSPPGAQDVTIRLYAVDSSDTIYSFHIQNRNLKLIQDLMPFDQNVYSLAVDENNIVYSGAKGLVQVWDHVPAKSIVSFSRHQKRITAMCVDEKHLYTAGQDNLIVVWQKNSPIVVKTLSENSSSITCLCQDENTLYSANEDGFVLMWNKNDLTLSRTIEMPSMQSQVVETVRASAVDTDNSKKIVAMEVDKFRIYAVSGGMRLTVWNKKTGEVLKNRFKLPFPAAVNLLRLSILDRSPVSNKRMSFKPHHQAPQPDQEHRLPFFIISEDKIYVSHKEGKQIMVLNKNTLAHLGNLESSITEGETLENQKLCCGCVYNGLLYAGYNNRIEVWNTEKRTLEKSIDLKDLNSQEKFKSIAVHNNRIYAGFLNHLKIMDQATGVEIDQIVVDSWHLLVNEGRVYCQSLSPILKVVELAAVNIPDFFQQVMSSARVDYRCVDLVNLHDELGRTALTSCAYSGNAENARRILYELDCNHTLTQCFGGYSPLFYILRERNWDFLEHVMFQSSILDSSGALLIPENRQISIDFKEDPATFQLLKDRAALNDVDFFTNLFRFRINFDHRPILSEAIRRNHIPLVQFWPNVEAAFALHEACFYGQTDCVRALMERTDQVLVNQADGSHDNARPLHVCFSNAGFSEVNYKGTTPTNKKWEDPDLFESYESELITRRLECAKIIMGAKEASKRPYLMLKNSNNKTIYDKALELHQYSIEKASKPRLEITEREKIEQAKKVFQDTAEILEDLHKFNEISKCRKKFANVTFLKEAGFFLIYLIILTLVATMSTMTAERQQYKMTHALERQLDADQIFQTRHVEDIWNWLNSTLVPSVFSETSADFSRPGYLLRFNKLMGPIQLRQIKITNDTCHTSNYLRNYIEDCYNYDVTYRTQDATPYGPDKIYQWSNVGDEHWSASDSYYPQGGYFVELSDSATAARQMLSSLKTNDWITRDTRLILVTLTVYNHNLDGVFAVIEVEFEFSAVGDITGDIKVVTIPPGAYDFSIIKLIIEIALAVYITREYTIQEFKEIYEHIEESSVEWEQIEALKKKKRDWIPYKQRPSIFAPNLTLAERFNLLYTNWNRGIKDGLADYWSELWNYFEWGIITCFAVIVFMRLYCTVIYFTVDMNPYGQFSRFNTWSTVLAYQHDLLAIFILMNWIRLLKFLRIPEFTGPMVQSIMDTLASRSVLVFFSIIFFQLVAFSLSYYIAFGNDIFAFSAFQESLITLFQVIFGGFEYPPMSRSSKVFGPILFIVFMLTINLVLMNLLIGVLGESYQTAQHVNTERWNRFITLLMIEEVEAEEEEELEEEQETVPNEPNSHHQHEQQHEQHPQEEGLVEEKIVYFDERFIDEWSKPSNDKANAALQTEQLEKQIQQLQHLLAQIRVSPSTVHV